MASTSEVKSAARAVEAVESIDKVIAWMRKDVEESAVEWGDGVRAAFGRNRLSKMTDGRIDQATFCAIVNDLLDKREAAVSEHCDLVDFPAPPCPRQNPPQLDQ